MFLILNSKTIMTFAILVLHLCIFKCLSSEYSYYVLPPLVSVDYERLVEVKSKFAETNWLKDRIFTSILLWLKPSHSVIQCTNLCEMDGDCNSVFYNAGDSWCVGNRLDFKNIFSIAHTDDVGTKAYIQIQGNCLSGFNEYQGKCYAVFDTAVIWDVAWQMCKNINADLLSMNSSDVQAFIENLLTDGNFVTSDFFIGLTDIQTPGVWQWMDRHGTYWPIEFNNWSTDETRDASEHCVKIGDRDGDWSWYYTPCSTARRFICQTDMY